jgi:hypothetical protein
VNAKALGGQVWQRTVKSIPAGNQRMLGVQVAEQTITAQADAGMSARRIAEVHEETAARNLSEATTRAAKVFAKEYDDTARILVRELEEMEMGQ